MTKELKKRQHYVWKHYLKPWTVNGKVYCQRNGETFHTNPINIGQKRYFYKSEPLSDADLTFLISFLQNVEPTARQSLYKLLDLYNYTTNSSEYLKKCGIEDFHSDIENSAITILEKLYLEDLSFFDNNYEEKNAFSLFVAAQYTRTNKIKNNILSADFKTPNINKENLGRVFHLFITDAIGNWIFSKAKLTLLINDSDIDLITGDQPVLNINGDPNYEITPEKFELYYPISPKKALYFSEKTAGEKNIKKNEVKEYNELIRKHSYEQLYSKQKLSDQNFLN